MSSHLWGEEDFDWKGLDEAGHLIIKTMRLYGRFGTTHKEKYGTLRLTAYFGELSLHSLFYPGYIYNQMPKWLWNLDCNYIRPFFEKTRLNYLFVKWQQKVYNYSYQLALRKYPHLRDEILQDCDYPEFVDGGMEVHNRYWTTLKQETTEDDKA